MTALQAKPSLGVPSPRKRPRWPGWLLVTVALVLGGLSLAIKITDNFDTVIPGLVYRSGQLSPESLESQIAVHHLRSIINLRGSNPAQPWWHDERAVAARLGVHHYDLSVESVLPPRADELAPLVRLLGFCDKPVLVHCQSGIDRSGVVSAISLLLLDPKATPTTAQEQLGLLYHHHLWWRESVRPHQAFLESYQDWLNQHGYSPCGQRFSHWAQHVYCSPVQLNDRPPAQAGSETSGTRAQAEQRVAIH